MLVMLMVENGIYFHIEYRYTTPKIKHATSVEELEKERVPLTTKLNFLKDNNAGKLTSIIDSDLRNKIAHLDFDIKRNEIYIRGQIADKAIFLGLVKLFIVFSTAEGLLRDLAEERSLVPKI